MDLMDNMPYNACVPYLTCKTKLKEDFSRFFQQILYVLYFAMIFLHI